VSGTVPPDRVGGDRRAGSAAEVLFTALRLGLTAFGGPIAHLGYFERVYVRQRRWLSASEYASLVALCQALPGPASSQAGFLIGLQRAGWRGALAAWAGFTLPSALLLYAGAALAARVQGPLALAALHGLKLLALAVVAQAVWSMAPRLCPDRRTVALALAALLLSLTLGGVKAHIGACALGAALGATWRKPGGAPRAGPALAVHPRHAWLALALFAALLGGLPLLAWRFPGSPAALAETFYRAGALVFGGGHVVLPLLRDALVPAGWLSDDVFLAGYGLAQAVPGPLFALAAYLGAVNACVTPPALGAAIALVALFLPGLLLAIAGAALWGRFARHARARGALAGVNAAVVGILLWAGAVRGGTDAAIALAGFVALARFGAPPLAVLGLCIGASVAAA
jgi:chromate transporter